jgi:hypothetical protein
MVSSARVIYLREAQNLHMYAEAIQAPDITLGYAPILMTGG